MSLVKCAFHFDYPSRRDLGSGCQFTDEIDFFECDGQHFCRFHLPLAAENGEKTAKGGWHEKEILDFQAAINRIVRRDTEANQAINLSGIVFPADVVFDGKVFGSLICYRARFTQRVSFQSATFDTADFSNAKFQGDAEFRDAEFQNDTDFNNARFYKNTDFSHAKFRGFSDFNNAEFRGYVQFRDAKFQGATSFSEVEFQGHAFFMDTGFQDGATFSKAGFQHGGDFINAEFLHFADFSNAKFQGDADFRDAEFQGRAYDDIQGTADFSNAEIQGNADFRDAEFQGHSNFSRANIQGNANFSHSKRARTPRRSLLGGLAAHLPTPKASTSESRGPTFQKFDFSRGYVGGVARFNNRIFNEPADFSRCRFVQAPLFHGCELQQGTLWIRTRFCGRKGHDAEQAYRTLRLAMNKIKDRPQEGTFFELEQIAIRSTLPLWDLKFLLSVGYAWSSAYGKSLGLPLRWLIATTILYFACYAVLDGRNIFDECVAEPLVSFTMQQIVRPFWIWSGSYTTPGQLFGGVVPIGFKALATLQSITSLALVGLFVLALRWRFRRA